MQSMAAGLSGTNSEQLTSTGYSSGCVQGLADHKWSGYTVFSPCYEPDSLSMGTDEGATPPAAEGDILQQRLETRDKANM